MSRQSITKGSPHDELSQSKPHEWACQYHVVFIPKYRKKAIYADLRRYLGDVLRRLAQRRESEVVDGRPCSPHVVD